MNELISVLMPVYNAEEFIEESIDSLLNQTYKNMEIIIIDDCSNDGTAQKIKRYSDKRIRYYKNEKNMGIVYSLNLGMSLANGEFMARMDADDICFPNRFEEQLKYMRNNPNLVLISCWFEMFGKVNQIIKYPKKHKEILTYCMIGNPMLHPGYFMNRHKIMESNLKYDENMKFAEDLDFVINVTNIGEVANVPKILMKYRTHNTQTSSIHMKRQFELGVIIRKKLVSKIGINWNDKEMELFQKICFEEYDNLYYEDIFKGTRLCKDVINKNISKKVFSTKLLRNVFCKKIQFLNIFAMENGIINKAEALRISIQISLLSHSFRFIIQYLKYAL